MNYTALPLDDLIASLDPENRRDFDRLRFGLAFDGVSSEQAAAMAIAHGYLAQVLSGKRPFERTEAVLFLMPLVELLGLHNDQKRDRKTKKTD
jgi:hypothetical protein